MTRLCAIAGGLALLLATAHAQDRAPLRILFIGNSLTSVNDVPDLVRRIGEADGRKVTTTTIAVNDSSLEDHWNGGAARREIARGRWDFVVLQQGPSALPESRELLRRSVARFNEAIRAAGARPALYMVWPALQRKADFDRVSESYRLAAADVSGVLLPAGDAWRAARQQDPALPLYAADNFHPSPTGSWLAALVIYCGLTDRDPGALSAMPRGSPEPRALLVKAAAAVFTPLRRPSR